MKKYTVVYGEPIGLQNVFAVKYKRIETDNVSFWLRQFEYKDNVHFIFEGWPLIENLYEI